MLSELLNTRKGTSPSPFPFRTELITIATCCRYSGYLLTHEAYFYCLDSLPLFFAMGVYVFSAFSPLRRVFLGDLTSVYSLAYEVH